MKADQIDRPVVGMRNVPTRHKTARHASNKRAARRAYRRKARQRVRMRDEDPPPPRMTDWDVW